jgi:hypothetical protein
MKRGTMRVWRTVGRGTVAQRRMRGGAVKPSIYRVDTAEVSVEISFGGQARARGTMFLRPSIVTLSGVESIADRMNDRDAFFPLRVGEQTPATALVGKTQVRYVSADNQPPPDDVITASDDALQFRMMIELDDGEEINGVFHAVMPQGKRRALDFINRESGLFVPFHVQQRQYVINRSFIRRLRDSTL